MILHWIRGKGKLLLLFTVSFTAQNRIRHHITVNSVHNMQQNAHDSPQQNANDSPNFFYLN